ncbi:MAG: glycosyltransferase family 2 protein [Planctomycetota bacterium]|nr:glycosyltransferase family 2 protein [Planctomycetota bacterium]
MTTAQPTAPTPLHKSEAPGRSATPGRTLAGVQIIIPTFNEELNLPHALRSVVGWASRVFVVDSESSDRTRDIAREAGAEVVVQKWLGYAKQKNWALDNLPITSDWVFILDADEALTPELRAEMEAIVSRPVDSVPESGFYVNRLTYFMGSPIRHAGFFPSYNLRLFKRGRARYEQRDVHEHMRVDGPTARLKHYMLHEDRRGLEHFIAKHNRYSTLESRELLRDQNRPKGELAEQLERGIAIRRWLKRNVLPKLPLSGLWRFLYMYILRLGFLDGAAGLRFCLLLATYDFFISLKLTELRLAGADKDLRLTHAAVPFGLAVREGHVHSAALTDTAAAAAIAPAESRAVPAAAPPQPAPAAQPLAPPAPVALPPAPAPPTRVAPQHAASTPVPDATDPRTSDLRQKLQPERTPPGRWPAPRSVKVSVLVPVKNEQRNMEHCLRRLQWADEIVVVDSQSSDLTIPISQAMNADVYQFYYSKQGWPKKKNWALENVPWRNEWVLILDADEYMTPELTEEVRQVVAGQWTPWRKGAEGCGDGYWLNRRFMFMGRWLKGCGFYPSYNIRLFRHKVGRYERIGTLGDTGSGDNEVHEHVVLSTGEAGYLRHDFLHYAYPDLSVWIEKHNRYTTWEAHAMEARDEGEIRASIFGGPIARRRWIKRFARRLPMRPTLRFIYSYVLQRGFLDGYPGFVMCRLLAWYEFVSIAKHREMKTPSVDAEPRR